MNDADRQALAAHLITQAQIEILQNAQQLQKAQLMQAAKIDYLASTMPDVLGALRDITGLLRILAENTPALVSGQAGIATKKPALQSGGAVVSLVPKGETTAGESAPKG